MLYQLSYLPTRRVRISDARGSVHDYSTDEMTPSAPDFSKNKVTMTTSPVLSSRVSPESATRSPPGFRLTRLVAGTSSRGSGSPVRARS